MIKHLTAESAEDAEKRLVHHRDTESQSHRVTEEGKDHLRIGTLGTRIWPDMPSHEEKLKRQAAKAAIRQAERERTKASLPMPVAQMKALFDFVDAQLSESECDHTLRHTIAFLDTQRVQQRAVLSWLEDAGGYCDCEVIANAEEKLESILPD